MHSSVKRYVLFAAKLAVSVGILVFIFRKVLEQENAEELAGRIAELSWGWIALAAMAQLGAIFVSVIRWDRLLGGQGIHAPWRHLFGSFMIGRFFGAFTPGGWTGLNGYRLYDIAVRTGKAARSTATIGVDMLLGKVGMGIVVMGGSIFGLRYIGATGVLVLDVAFGGLIATIFVLLARPQLFRWLAGWLPEAYRARLQTLVDGVCAYEGRGALLAQVGVLAVATHAFNSLIYLCAARALGLELGVGEVFFVSTLQILATLVPISINGVGLREAAAVSLYTIVGVPAGLAVLIPIVGVAVEYAISSFGGVVFLMRKHERDPRIVVEEEDREDRAHAAIPTVPAERWPRVGRGFALGLGAGVLAGALVGIAETSVVLAMSNRATAAWGSFAYGAVAYGLLCAGGGAVAGALFAWSGRWLKREAVTPARAYARLTALMVAGLAFALGAFRVRRDVFEEQLAWKSLEGLAVLAGCAAAAVVLFAVLAFTIRVITEYTPARLLLRAWGTPAIVGVLVAAVAAVEAINGGPAHAAVDKPNRPAAPPRAGNVLFIVVDTLRADRLEGYGYGEGKTPNLQEFAQDAIRFEEAFAQASWTRPSFASILTSRYAASHRTMGKSDALPGALVTMPEAFSQGGYYTSGFVTNYNLSPFFNFQQGFDEYHYLEPDYVLGASGEASKLLFVRAVKKAVQKMRPAQPGSAYQDAETVNRRVYRWLDRKPQDPFFLFVAYMDPHDPYFEHPYDGSGGYARAAHRHPDPSMAPELSRLYDGEITYWDEHFGKLMDDLKKRGLYEDLTIVVTSDHGEEFMDHGGFWHGTTLYDEQVHVPLYVKLPHGRRGGTEVSHWVETIDLMPTMLRLNGAEVPEDVQGGDLFEDTGRVYAEESHEGNVLEALRHRRGGSEVKLIEANANNPRGLEEEELYRVDQDPQEEVNLADQRPELLDLSQKRLDDVAEQATKGAVEGRKVSPEDSAEAQDKLRALGYAE